MTYDQVKYEEEKSNTSAAQKRIDMLYPHVLHYQRIRTWQVWKSWVSSPRRHKEYDFRVWERTGSTWIEITEEMKGELNEFPPGEEQSAGGRNGG
ncbi:hypothetical protein [Thermogymnomonas acidicola]|uniref:hypothetical protein n=1 Tax=Thermogymnomonas acidicola TaxID=399579 RepID=UPI00094617E3|nr:hypothetical protein [Thermogymnomonas acidicola]